MAHRTSSCIPAEVPEQLIASPIIRKVSFTGSVPVGRHLAQQAARFLKRITLELGGHAPVLVCADADIDQTVTLMVAHKFRNARQACLAPTRFYVERGIERRFTEALIDKSRRLILGNGMDPQAQITGASQASKAWKPSWILQTMQEDTKRWGPIVKKSGFKAD